MVRTLVGVNENNRRVGESHPQAKLTDRDAERLQELREQGMGWGKLAAMFDISKTQARRICLGQKRQVATRWRSIPVSEGSTP